MKTHYYITGTSSGLGRALTNTLLKAESNHVFGISRTRVTQSDRYNHLQVDLSQPALPSFSFDVNDCDTVVLINNAGWIGPVTPLGEQSDSDIENAIGVNLQAPIILINRFLKQTNDFEGRRLIVNISSGAANYPIAAWSTYCASKAALDMVTQVIREETPDVEIISIAPGIVNTNMQRDIRNANPNQFADHSRFMEYFEKGDLVDPFIVAEKILKLLTQNLNSLPAVISVRDY
jgi:benzil reductase ((S)-benzoin forming)